MSGLFSTFNTAKSGMTAQQTSIDVTSHNIANSNTIGYTRQVAKIVTTKAYTSSIGIGQIGTGAEVSKIDRIRDNFLDYQIRNQNSTLGKYEERYNFLNEVENILSEPSDKGLSSLMGKFFDSFQELSKQPNSSNARTVAAQQTLALTDALNNIYTQIESLNNNAQDMIKSTVTEVNSLLSQIDSVNQEIISVTVAGNTPNDLMDKRDLLIDELSVRFGVTIEQDKFNGVNIKPTDSLKMSSNLLVNSSPNGNISKFSYVTSVDKDPSDLSGSTYIVTYYKNGDMTSESNKQTMKVVGINEEKAENILNTRVLWANSDGQASRSDGYAIKNNEVINYEQLMMFSPSTGSISGLVTVQEDIRNYMNQLDKLAKSIALSVNAIHSGSTTAEGDDMPFFVNSDTAKYKADGTLNLEALNDEKNITAKNITVNKEILEDVMKIVVGKDGNSGEGDGSRALAIAQLRDSLVRIQDINETVITREDLFDASKGGSKLDENGLGINNISSGIKLDSYFKDTIDRLGVQTKEASRMVKNQSDLLYSLEESRASVSGVSLDEEMANLIQFKHAYNANAKIISTVNELLDVVINGLKR